VNCRFPTRGTGHGALPLRWTLLLGHLLACGACADDAAAGAAHDAGSDAALAGPASVPLGPDVQAQYRGEPRHDGLAPAGARLGSPLVQRWVTEPMAIGDYTASKSSPALDATRLYVGMDDGVLYALERDDGRLAWRFATHRAAQETLTPGPTHYGIHGSPAVDDERVYVGDYAGYLYAVARSDGALAWERKLGDSIGASPVLHGGALYIAVEYGAPLEAKLFVVEAHSGDVLLQSGWLGEQAHSSVTLDTEAELGFVGDNAGGLHAIDLRDGSERWTHRAAGPIKSTAALHDGLLYVTSWDHALYALDARDGSVRFTYRAAGPSMSSPSVFDGLVLFGAYDRQLHALDARSGLPRWRFTTQGDLQSSPTVVADSQRVLIGSRDGWLYVLDAHSGELDQALELGAELTSVPVVVDGQVYIADDAGRVFRFDGRPE
jgi:outer membrane protein assembly factor BamB